MNSIGKLYFRYGTMGSAKTALLLTTACILSNNNGYRWDYPQNAALAAGL